MTQREVAPDARQRRSARSGIRDAVAGQIDLSRSKRRYAGILIDVTGDRAHGKIAGTHGGKPRVKRNPVTGLEIHTARKLGVEINRGGPRLDDRPRAGLSRAARHEGAERRRRVDRALAHGVLPAGHEDRVGNFRGVKIHGETRAFQPQRLVDKTDDGRVGHLGFQIGIAAVDVGHALKAEARAAGEIVGDVAVGLTAGGEEFVDVGRPDITGARGADAQIGVELPDRAGLPRIGIATGRVIRVPEGEAGRQLLHERQILQQRDLRFGELFHDRVATRKGLVVRQPVGASDREGVGRGRGFEFAPMQSGGDRHGTGGQIENLSGNLRFDHVLRGRFFKLRGAHDVVQGRGRGRSGTERIEGHAPRIGGRCAGHNLSTDQNRIGGDRHPRGDEIVDDRNTDVVRPRLERRLPVPAADFCVEPDQHAPVLVIDLGHRQPALQRQAVHRERSDTERSHARDQVGRGPVEKSIVAADREQVRGRTVLLVHLGFAETALDEEREVLEQLEIVSQEEIFTRERAHNLLGGADAETVAAALKSVRRADGGREPAVIVRALRAAGAELDPADERVVGGGAAGAVDDVTAGREGRADVRHADHLGRVARLGDLVGFFAPEIASVAVHAFALHILAAENEVTAAIEILGPEGDRTLILLIIALLRLTEEEVGLEADKFFVEHEIHDTADGIGTIRGRGATVHDVHPIDQTLRHQVNVNLSGRAAGGEAAAVQKRQRARDAESPQVQEIGAVVARATADGLAATGSEGGQLFQTVGEIDRRGGEQGSLIDHEHRSGRSKRAGPGNQRARHVEGFELEDLAGQVRGARNRSRALRGRTRVDALRRGRSDQQRAEDNQCGKRSGEGPVGGWAEVGHGGGVHWLERECQSGGMVNVMTI